MKIVLAAINAKYIHSNLAVYSLKAYARDPRVEIAEYTINQTKDEILGDLYRREPDLLCFSCYIWNLNYVEDLAVEFAKVCKTAKIWIGGPEVSYDPVETLKRLPVVEGIMKGEGEETFACLCRIFRDGEGEGKEEADRRERELEALSGITYRDREGRIRDHPWREPIDLSTVPFVYEQMEIPPHRIIYYESSRGCPFSCSYCLSSVDKKLRFRDLSMVKRELQYLIDREVPQVKFVDRTFNVSHSRALEIWEYLLEHDRGKTNFHFEVAADLLNEEELSLIARMRPGLIQLEIGVQSTNPATICEIRRRMDVERVKEVVSRIRKKRNVHQHLDLIAGLPFEDLDSFRRSFDQVYEMRPDQLQLGFLKVLKGSYMEEMQKSYGLVCQSRPPYEVLETRWLSYKDVLLLKGVEEMVEVYYNSGQFAHTLRRLEHFYDSPFRMFESLWEYYQGRDLQKIRHRREARYEILLAWAKEGFPEEEKEIRELLICDYYLRENAKNRPAFAGPCTVDKEKQRRFYEKEAEAGKYLPDCRGYDKNQLRRMTHLEYFSAADQYVLFDYFVKNPLNQDARVCKIDVEDMEEKRNEF
ncbi:B12-binding domain-containing radical SAM protein [uncultured Merdimonas sp.]|uniref:B12-binding domain-containing radical SAM protein n=1 Tax=uncultured Merdimonas sp. TaxID=2023269 RepID=UPI0032088E66